MSAFLLENVSEKLKKTRKRFKYSSAQIAKKLNIAKSTYLNYEGGKRQIPLDLLKKICELYKVSSDYFLFEHFEERGYIVEENILNLHSDFAELKMISVKFINDYFLFARTEVNKSRALMLFLLNGKVLMGKVYTTRKIIILHDDSLITYSDLDKVEFLGTLAFKAISTRT